MKYFVGETLRKYLKNDVAFGNTKGLVKLPYASDKGVFRIFTESPKA